MDYYYYYYFTLEISIACSRLSDRGDSAKDVSKKIQGCEVGVRAKERL